VTNATCTPTANPQPHGERRHCESVGRRARRYQHADAPNSEYLITVALFVVLFEHFLYFGLVGFFTLKTV
jgi:hypothetical protein